MHSFFRRHSVKSCLHRDPQNWRGQTEEGEKSNEIRVGRNGAKTASNEHLLPPWNLSLCFSLDQTRRKAPLRSILRQLMCRLIVLFFCLWGHAFRPHLKSFMPLVLWLQDAHSHYVFPKCWWPNCQGKGIWFYWLKYDARRAKNHRPALLADHSGSPHTNPY